MQKSSDMEHATLMEENLQQSRGLWILSTVFTVLLHTTARAQRHGIAVSEAEIEQSAFWSLLLKSSQGVLLGCEFLTLMVIPIIVLAFVRE